MEMMEDQSDIAYHMPVIEEYASHAGVIIELGCGNGNGSTRALARGLRRSKAPVKCMITVDMNPDLPVERPAEDWWHKVTGRSESLLVMCEAECLTDSFADLIFIDTVHTYDQIKSELIVWSAELANRDTVWLFHDTWMFGEYNRMTDAIKEFASGLALEWNLVYEDLSKESHGLGVMHK